MFETFSRTTQLTRDFTMEDFFQVDLAERLGGEILEQQLAGMNDEEIVRNCARLATTILQPVQDRFPACKVVIKSGVRGRLLNDLLKSSKYSYHQEGLAVDCAMLVPPATGNGAFQLFTFLKDNIDRFGIDTLVHAFGSLKAPSWVHINLPREWIQPQGRVGYIGEYTGRAYMGTCPW